jgi:hypothetical protein
MATPRCEATPLDTVDIFIAPVGGCLVHKVALGAQRRCGDISPRSSIRSPRCRRRSAP